MRTTRTGAQVRGHAGTLWPYVKWAKVNATLPKGVEPEAITLDEALVLIAEKAGKSTGKKTGKAKAAKAPPKSGTKSAARSKAAGKAKG